MSIYMSQNSEIDITTAQQINLWSEQYVWRVRPKQTKLIEEGLQLRRNSLSSLHIMKWNGAKSR